jgi:hypothetical protein
MMDIQRKAAMFVFRLFAQHEYKIFERRVIRIWKLQTSEFEKLMQKVK